jgi:hypothetical protein
MKFLVPARRRRFAAASAVLSCAASMAPAQAQQIVAYSTADHALECVISGRRVDGVSVVLHHGPIGSELEPSLIALPHELWPPGAGYGGSPQFDSLDLDCSMPAALDERIRYRKSFAASSRFWVSDLSGEPVLPNANRQIMLVFRSYDAFSSDTLSTDTYLVVRGEYAPLTVAEHWSVSNWQRYRFPKELKRAMAPPGAANGAD